MTPNIVIPIIRVPTNDKLSAPYYSRKSSEVTSALVCISAFPTIWLRRICRMLPDTAAKRVIGSTEFAIVVQRLPQ